MSIDERSMCISAMRRTAAAASAAMRCAAEPVSRENPGCGSRPAINPPRGGTDLFFWPSGDLACNAATPEIASWLHACVNAVQRLEDAAEQAIAFAEQETAEAKRCKAEAESAMGRQKAAERERDDAVARLKAAMEEQDGKPGEVRQFHFWIDGIRDTFDALTPARSIAGDVGGRLNRGMPFEQRHAHRKVVAHIEYVSRAGVNITRIIKRALLAEYGSNVFFYAGGVAVPNVNGLMNEFLDPDVLARHPRLAPGSSGAGGRIVRPSGNGDFGDR